MWEPRFVKGDHMEKRLWFSIVSAAIGVGLIIAASATAASSTSFLGSDIIVGMQDVLDGKASSVSGVTAKGNKLAIKLTHAAPDLLARLATPPFQAITASLAGNHDPAGVNTYASCGPYYY